MLREIAFIVIPLGLPSLLVFVWRLAGRKPVAPMPWLRCLAAGVVLMAGTLGALAVYDKEPVGGTYRPARIEDGRIVPGGVEYPGETQLPPGGTGVPR